MKQYRLVVLGNQADYYSHFIYGTLEGAIRNGMWAKGVELKGRPTAHIQAEIDFFKPHFIVCHCIFGPLIPSNIEMLKGFRKKYGTKVIYHMGDARDKPRFNGPINNCVDLALVNRSGNQFSKIWKIPTIHWPYMCFYQKEIADYDEQYACGMAFTGSLDGGQHHKPRKDFINGLKGVGIKLFPTRDTGNTRFLTAELSSSANSVLGMQMGEQIEGYQDVRPFQYIGAGALYFHDHHNNMDLFFDDKIHYVGYNRNDKNDITSKHKHYTENKEKAQKIRQQGFDFCQKHHSSKQRVENILRYFDGKELLPIYKKDIM